MNYAVTTGRWQKLGHASLSEELSKPTLFFKQDPINPKKLWISYPDGSERKATLTEIDGLERLAVWDPDHAEERLEDYFSGKPNRWVESLKIKT
jgi:hypothetical protein